MKGDLMALSKEDIKANLIRRYKGIYYLFYIHPLTQIHKSVTTKTDILEKAETFQNNFIHKLENEINQQSNVEEIIYTIQDLENKIIELETHNSQKLPASKIASNIKVIQRIFSFFKLYAGGNKNLKSITPLDVEDWKFKRNNDISDVSVNIEYRSLKSWLNKAVFYNWIVKNPFKGIKQFKIADKGIVCFTTKEYTTLINTIKLKTFSNIVKFGWLSGCRESEILSLCWSEIDFKKQTIYIRNKENFLTKSRRNRIIPMSKDLELLLKTMFNEHTPNEFNYVFAKENGYKYTLCYISRKFKYYIRKANLSETFTFHKLRHTMCSRLISKSNIFYAKEILGHSSITTTQLYAHSNNKLLLEAMNKMKNVTL